MPRVTTLLSLVVILTPQPSHVIQSKSSDKEKLITEIVCMHTADKVYINCSLSKHIIINIFEVLDLVVPALII